MGLENITSQEFDICREWIKFLILQPSGHTWFSLYADDLLLIYSYKEANMRSQFAKVAACDFYVLTKYTVT